MSRFRRYADKVFNFSDALGDVTDSRIAPRIETQEVLTASVSLMLTRMGSLNAIEQEQRKAGGNLGVSADSMGRIMGLIDPDSLRNILCDIAHQLKRNKCFPGSPLTPLIFVAVDGHELFASKHRCCSSCLVRTIEIKGQPIKEYYHRVVVCHLTGFPIALPLDAEPIGPKEGELTAAHRLMKRVFANYSRFFDGVVGDALYMNVPFFNLCEEHGKYVTAVLKNDERHLYRDADGLFASLSPSQFEERGTKVSFYDLEGFNSCENMSVPIRVLQTRETTPQRKRVAGQWVNEIKVVDWRWATTTPKTVLSSQQLWRVAHSRWDIENDAFNVLSQHWHLDHCFKHEPVAIINFILILCIVFTLVQCFYLRNLKPQCRKHRSLIQLTRFLYRTMNDPIWAIAPVPPAPSG